MDVAHEINAVQRHVGSRVLEAGEARTVTVSRIYDAPLDDVWDACTDAERIPRWFLPISGELRVGGRYQLEGNAGGTIERCDPPNGFAATWEFAGDMSWIELRLTAEGESRTRFELQHTMSAGDSAHWTEFGPGAVGLGWELGLWGLAMHLPTGASVDREAAAAWMASDEARAFLTASGHAWGAAAIAAGEDPAVARASAARTIAAYTGAEAPDSPPGS